MGYLCKKGLGLHDISKKALCTNKLTSYIEMFLHGTLDTQKLKFRVSRYIIVPPLPSPNTESEC